MHLLDEQISLTDGNVFVRVQKPPNLGSARGRREKLRIDLSFISGCRRGSYEGKAYKKRRRRFKKNSMVQRHLS